jgi:hypothetical protein
MEISSNGDTRKRAESGRNERLGTNFPTEDWELARLKAGAGNFDVLRSQNRKGLKKWPKNGRKWLLERKKGSLIGSLSC